MKLLTTNFVSQRQHLLETKEAAIVYNIEARKLKRYVGQVSTGRIAF
jgi:hypothetical protein